MRDVDASRRAGLTLRAALLAGFGLTFGIWLFAGYYFTRRMADVESRAATINSRYIQAQELLSNVRAQILIGSVYVRDALLETDPSVAAAYRRRLDESDAAVNQALAHYVPVLNSEAERARVDRLRHEITDFHAAMARLLATDPVSPPRDPRALLRSEIVPKREVVIRVSEDVQSLNREAFVRQQAGIAEVYGVTQRRVWIVLGVALTTSFGVGLLAILYAGRLEDRLRRQRAHDIENARNLQQLSAKLITAQEEERRSIARELHDEVGQVLTAIKVELAVAQRSIDRGAGAPHLLDDARSVTDGALTLVRDLSHLLHPALLDDLGLAAAVEWYLRGFGKRHDIRVDLLHDRMDARLSQEVEATAYRIVQEALTNVAKHANATLGRVYLQRLPSTIVITVEDDGRGFDIATTERVGERRGLGLISIRERVASLGGTMRLESLPGKGTRLTVELPARVRPTLPDAMPLHV